MALVPDARINVFVNHILVKRGIDTSKIRWSTQNGIVYLDGELHQLTTGLVNSPKYVHIIERQIRVLQGVRGVKFTLAGWKKVGGDWVLKKQYKGPSAKKK